MTVTRTVTRSSEAGARQRHGAERPREALAGGDPGWWVQGETKYPTYLRTQLTCENGIGFGYTSVTTLLDRFRCHP